MSMTIYDICKHIHQIGADAGQDHAYGGRKTDILRREEGCPIIDSRVMDGFGVKINGNNLIITYHCEVNIKKSHEDKFEEEQENYLDQLADFIKKEFKSDTGSALTLKEKEDTFKALMQQTSNVRTFVTSQKVWEIGNIKDLPEYNEEADEREAMHNKIDRMLNEGYKPELIWKKYLGQI